MTNALQTRYDLHFRLPGFARRSHGARDDGSRRSRELTDDDIAHIADAYHGWRDDADAYEDLAGFCRSAPLDEVGRHGHVPTPGRYLGAKPQPDGSSDLQAEIPSLLAFNAALVVSDGLEARIGALWH